MKSWKLAMLGLVAGVCIASIYSAPAFAQSGMTAAPPARISSARKTSLRP